MFINFKHDIKLNILDNEINLELLV